MRRVLWVLLAVAVLLPLAAVAGFAVWFDQAEIKARIADAVRQATGRELTLAGPIEVGWSFTPTLRVRDVRLANPPGFSRPDMALIDAVEAQVALWPLLSRRVEVRGVTVQQPDVLLECDAEGRGNWVFARAAEPPSTGPMQPASVKSRMDLYIDGVRIRDGRFAWRSGERLTELRAPNLLASSTGAADLVRVDGALIVARLPLTVTGTTGPLGAVAIMPLDLRLAGTGLSVTAVGVPAEAVDLTAAVADLASLSPAAGRTLPAVQGVQLSARLLAGKLASLKAQAGPAELGTLMPGLSLTRANLDAPALEQPVQLAADAVLRGQPVTLAGNVGSLSALFGPGPIPVQVSLGVMPQGDLAGDFVIGWQPRPSIRGSLASQRLDLDAWAMGMPTAPLPPAPPVASAPGPDAPPTRLLPDTPLPFAALRRMDADVHLAVAEMTWRGRTYRELDAQVLLQDGRLRLDPMRFVTPGGLVTAQVGVGGAAESPDVALTAWAPGLAIGPLLGIDAIGALDLDVALRGSGRSVREIAAALDGHVGAAMVDGELENRWLVDHLGEALRVTNLPFDAGGRSRVRCLAVRVDAVKGQATVRALLLDTTRLRLEGEGRANLAAETLDLRLRPLVRLGGAGVGVSARVGGTFLKPQVAMDAGATQPGRIGVVIGALTQGSADECGPALVLARDGKVGPAPAAPEARSTKPADLLRGLFR